MRVAARENARAVAGTRSPSRGLGLGWADKPQALRLEALESEVSHGSGLR
jgi:hypothetical protein